MMATAFWDFSTCLWYRVPYALLWRWFYRIRCWASSRHSVIPHWETMDHGWFHMCRCGYFGHMDQEDLSCPDREEEA